MISPLLKIPAPAPATALPATPSAKPAGSSFASFMQAGDFEQHESIAPQAPAANKLPAVTPHAKPLTPKAQFPPPQTAVQLPPAPSKPIHAPEPQAEPEPASAPESGDPGLRTKAEKKDPKMKESRKPAVPETAPAPAPPPVAPITPDVRPLTLSLPKEPAPPASTETAPSRNAGATENPSPDPLGVSAAEPSATGVSQQNEIRPVRKAPVAFSVSLPKAAQVSLPAVPRTPAANPTAPSAKNSPEPPKQSQPLAARPNPATSEADLPAAAPHKSAPELLLKSQPATVLTNVIPANSAAGIVPASQHVPAAYSNQLNAKAQNTLSAAPVEQVSEAAPLNAGQRPQTIDLKIAGDQNGDVAVRISQRAGDVQVTVRTADGDLAQSLKQHLPELSDRLVQTGVHGDIWQPSASQSSSAESNGNGGADSWKGHDAQSQQQGRSPGNAPDPNDEESSKRSSSAWIDELMNAKKEN